MKLMTVLFATLFLTTGVSFAGSESFKPAEDAKNWILHENSKLKRNPNEDFEKVHKICGKPWHKGCVWKEVGSEKWTFQKLEDGKPSGKIYDIPGMFTRK